MQFGQYNFKPQIVSMIIALIGLTILINLGNWQVERAEEKEIILKDVADRKSSLPLSLSDLDNIEDKDYYNLSLKGHFDANHTLILDNRFYKSRVGFEVLQPFVVDSIDGEEQRVVLVNRGWIPLPIDRTILPQIPKEEGLIKIVGEVNIPKGAIVLKKDVLAASASWPILIQSIDINDLTNLYAELNMTLDPWVLRQTEDDVDFYQQDWIFVSMQPARHLSYAVTWFGLALVLIIIYIAAHTSREEL